MKTPRPLVTIEVRPGVFLRMPAEKAAAYSKTTRVKPASTTTEPETSEKKKAPTKNKKAATYDTKGE